MAWSRRIAWLAASVALMVGGALVYHRYAPRHVPTGQPPLGYVTAATFGDLRAAFNAASDRKRLLLLLSPT
jgi:predicted small integral membrane protein